MLVIERSQDSLLAAITSPFTWPIAYLILFLPLGLVFSLLRSVPGVGLAAVFFSLMAVSLGDPLVALLHKFDPRLVPVESPPLFSLSLIFWILDAPELAVAE